MYKKDNLLVSVGVAVYNAKDYIRECLDNIINQKTDFKFEILINDDCSTDGTAEIIKEYELKYPDIVKPIYQKENQYQQGKGIIQNFVFPRVRTKYLAICDGDDYWCDEYKLQKQVDFLESKQDYTLCYHPAKMVYIGEEHKAMIIGKSTKANPQPLYDLLRGNNIPAGSVMYRFDYLQQAFAQNPEDIYPRDWFNHIIAGVCGKIGYLPDVMYVYRWHSQGVSHTVSDDPVKEIHLKYGVKEVNFSFAVWNKIKEQFPQYYKDVFIPVLRDVYFVYLKNGKFKELELLQKNYAECFKDINLNTGINEINNYRKKYKKYKKLLNLLLLFVFVILFCVFLILLLFLQ